MRLAEFSRPLTVLTAKALIKDTKTQAIKRKD